VLDAQYLLTSARNNYNNTLATYNLALARLLRAIGRGLEVKK
jgi:outer membrane protein TolC